MHLNFESLTLARWSVHTVFCNKHKTTTQPTEATQFLEAHQVATAASSKPLLTPASETESLARSSAALPYSGSLQSPPPGHCSEPSGAISLPNLKQTCRRTGNKRLKKMPQRRGQVCMHRSALKQVEAVGSMAAPRSSRGSRSDVGCLDKFSPAAAHDCHGLLSQHSVLDVLRAAG